LIFFSIFDYNTLYGMDQIVSFYPLEQESIFILTENGFRTRQGCLDLDRWFQEYDLRINTKLVNKLSLYYNLKTIDDYYRESFSHTFYIRYKLKKFSIETGISPDFMKKNDRLFLGVYKDCENGIIEIDLGLRDFVHNYVLSKKNESLRDPYSIFPFFASVRFAKIFNGFINISIEKGFKGKKEIFLNDSLIGNEFYQDYDSYLSFLIPFFKNLYLGGRLNYWIKELEKSGDRFYYSQIISNLFIRKDGNIKIEPSLSFELYESKDTLLFKRIDFISGFNIIKEMNKHITINFNFQDSRKKMRKNEDLNNNFEQRLTIGIILNFTKNTSFYIVEGIELDHFSMVFKKINYLHNHTFLTFTTRF